MNEVRQTPSGVSVVKFNKELVRKEIEKLQAENKKLREALEFYAKETNWKLNKNNHAPLFSKCENDLGDIAREALKEIGNN
jgi:hypothetical protein